MNVLDSNKKEEEVILLKKLVDRVKKEIDKGISIKSIEPEEENFFSHKVTDFEYTDKGVTKYGGSWEPTTKKVWYKSINKVKDLLKNSEEYKAILESGPEIKDNHLDSFLGKLISNELEQTNLEDLIIDKIIKVFVDDLNEEPIRCGADIKLEGVIILSEKINFKVGDTDVAIRPTNIADLEKDIPIYDFLIIHSPYVPTPSAILHIKFFGRGPREIQDKVHQAISILRLFRVGSVKDISYHMFSESVIRLGFGTLSSGDHPFSYEKYVIKDEDLQVLKEFWIFIINYLPQNFYDMPETNIDHLSIAYKRYCDALLERGEDEKRITNAVMGLESLYLKSEEKQELAFRLKTRIAKTLSKLDFNPHDIKKIVGKAYDLRSSYVHGGHLTYEERVKLIDRYGEVKNFIKSILNYLRISILIMIFIRKSKVEFLDLIDNSLIDKEKDTQLENLINNIKNFIPIN